ncbi:MAG: AAA family ATPase, partial [Methanobrevibacter sp.]|nr:AAA family ATPase [Methanobrevibacter sp.]
MAKTIDKSNLGYLGIEFQYKLAKYLVEDNNFFNEIANIVDQNAFTDTLLKTFVGTIKDYYNKENIVPTYETLEILLRSKSTDEIQIREWEELIAKLKKTSYDGNSVVKDNAIKFFRQQRLIKAANKMLEKVGNGDIEQFDECQKMIEDAMSLNTVDDYGYSLFDLEEKALSNDYTVSVPTGVSGLDEVLGGGLDKGKIGLIIGPLGFGKSTLATAFSSAAAASGWKVLQIYFEDDDVDITRKHFSRITGVEACEFKRLDDVKKQSIIETIANHPDSKIINENLRLKSFRTGEVSATDIGNFIKKLTNKGFKPDMVVIDYFECLAFEKAAYQSESEWSKEGKTMRKLENLAKELNVAMWLPTQGNKDSIVAEIVTVDKAGGSIKKGQIAQVIISIARTIEDRENNRATLALLKNRSGKGTKVFRNIYFDN